MGCRSLPTGWPVWSAYDLGRPDVLEGTGCTPPPESAPKRATPTAHPSGALSGPAQAALRGWKLLPSLSSVLNQLVSGQNGLFTSITWVPSTEAPVMKNADGNQASSPWV